MYKILTYKYSYYQIVGVFLKIQNGSIVIIIATN